jgi:hypothetical protein
MSDSQQMVVGLAIFAVGLASTAWTVALTARFSRGGGAIESMLQRSFLPEKRRIYLTVLSVEGSLLLLSGLLWGATEGGLVPEGVGAGLVAACLAGGMVCVGSITWLGLRPSRLTVREQASLRNRALYSLVLAPMMADAGTRSAGGAERFVHG